MIRTSSRLLRLLLASSLVAACGSGGPGPIDAGSTCVPTGAVVATHTGTVSANERWEGIHEVTGTLAVTGGTLTIAPCTEVRLGADANIELSGMAVLSAEGTEAAPIRFVRSVSTAAWGHLYARAPARISLAFTSLEGGGTSKKFDTADQLGASLAVRGDPAALEQVLKVTNLAVLDSSGVGVFLNAARFTTDSSGLVVKGSGFYPVLLGADCASELPEGNYTGNAFDEILLQTAGVAAAYEQQRPIASNVTLRHRGVPYRVGTKPSAIIVGDGLPASPNAKLTIEPGVVLRFTPQATSGSSELKVQAVLRNGSWTAQGSLVAVGTAAKPILFTSASATPAAGDWQGLYFKDVVDAASRVDHAIIEYAGGASYSSGVCEWKPAAGNTRADASVILFLQSDRPPATQFITNTRLAHSPGAGFYRAWNVAELDFRPSNTFVSIGGCLQTNVPNASNLCPTTACPVQ